MNRRRFLQGTGVGFLGLMVFPQLLYGRQPRVALASGVLYRADWHGRVHVSRDEGRSWQLHTNLGPGYRVRRLALDRLGRVTARVSYAGRDFGLFLARDERSWRTL